MARLAKERKEWAGMPTPLMGERLAVEKSYPFADQMAKINQLMSPAIERDAEAEALDKAKIRNTFWSWSRRSDVTVWELDGKINWGISAAANHIGMELSTMGCADAWSLDTENTALESLRCLVSHRQFRQYLLTGSFLETSKRSRVVYLFRKLRPTLAVSFASGQTKALCALCLHPIAYYAGTWCGAMCPTDDVVAHLMMMRGDEHLFWKRANQHAPWRPEAGI